MCRYLVVAKRALAKLSALADLTRSTIDLTVKPAQFIRTASRENLLEVLAVASAASAIKRLLDYQSSFANIVVAVLFGRVSLAFGRAKSRDAHGVAYGGGRVRVQRSKITRDMCVPSEGSVEHPGDIEAGAIAMNLFTEAVVEGALIAPEGVRIECYGEDDDQGGVFLPVAYLQDPHTRGVTAGWRDTGNIAAAEDEDPHNAELVLAALECFAGELNFALTGDRFAGHPRCSRPPRP